MSLPRCGRAAGASRRANRLVTTPLGRAGDRQACNMPFGVRVLCHTGRPRRALHAQPRRRYEIKDIMPPRGIVQAMELQVRALRPSLRELGGFGESQQSSAAAPARWRRTARHGRVGAERPGVAHRCALLRCSASLRGRA